LPYPLTGSWERVAVARLEKSAEPQPHFAAAVGLRASLPLNDHVFHLVGRAGFGARLPITHVIASATLLLPHPFGPTIAVTPLSKAISTDRKRFTAVDLRRFKTLYTPQGIGRLADADCRTKPQSNGASEIRRSRDTQRR